MPKLSCFLLLSALALTACERSDSPTPEKADSTPPTATAILPVADATDVAPNTEIIVAFDEAIEPGSAGPGAFHLTDGVSEVPLTVVHDQTNDLVTLVPDATLAIGTRYTVVARATITDLAGNSLGADFSWSFTTASPAQAPDTSAPAATTVVPLSAEIGVDVSTRIIVAFDERIDPASVTTGSFQLLEGTTVVAAAISHDTANNLLILLPDVRLAHETTYTAQVSGSIADLAGNALGTGFSWSFTTRTDNTVPQLLQISPGEDATDVALDAVLTAQFDEAIDPASLAGFGISGVAGTATVAGDGTVVRFAPDQPLANLTAYQANLPSTLTDLAGNTLNFARSWTFTTLADQLAPRVIQTTPGEGEVIPIGQQQVTIEFDEPLDFTTVDTSSITATESGQPFPINFVTLSPGNRINVNLPQLSYDTDYTVELATTIADLVGNALDAPFVLAFSVEPDDVAPTVTGRAPGIDGRVVPPGALLKVQFSEPMDRNLISPATVSIQGVGGIVSYDDTSDTATFIPDADLTPGQQYTAEVSASLTDLAGNPLPTPESWTFTVDGAPLLLSDDSNAGHGPARVAFAGTDGFAVWSVASGTGVKLVAARRNPSSTTFDLEQTITEYPDDPWHLQPVIGSNGTTFVAVWVRPYTSRIYASVFSGGSWSPPEELGVAGGGTGRLDIISNGSTYAAGWNNSFTYFASIFDGTSWSTATLGATSTTGSGVVGPLELASDGTGYAMSWVGRVSVYDGASWSTTRMPSTTRAEIAAGSTGYAVSWRQFATTFPGLDYVYARVYDGSSWSPSVRLTSAVEEGVAHDIASDGATYAVIATAREDGPTGDTTLDFYQFNGTNWALTNLQTAAWNETGFSDLRIASNGTNYAVSWRRNDEMLASVALGAPQTLFAANVDETFLVAGGGNYFAVQNDSTGRIRARAFVNSWLSEAALSATDSAAESLDVLVNGSGVLIGYGTDTADARMATYGTFSFGGGTATVSANRLLVTDTHLASARNPVSAVNGAGDTMVVWEQFEAGAWQIRGRSYRNGSAAPVRLIAISGQAPDIAADASTFMIVWESGGEMLASRYTPATNTLTPATVLGATNPGNDPSIASNGSGFVAGWTEARNVLVAEFTGAWGTPQTLYTDTSAFQESALVASAVGEYAIVWIDDNFNSDAINAMVRSAGTWGARTLLDSGNSITSPVLLSNGSSYAALYREGPNATARIHDGAVWGAATALGSGAFLAATDGSEYRVLYGNTRLDERIFAAGAWGDPIDSNLRAGSLASDGMGYALLGVDTNGDNHTLFSSSRSAAGWSLSIPVASISAGKFQIVRLEGDAGAYRTLWTQPDGASVIAQRLWLLPDD